MSTDLALLVLRIILGYSLFAHGTQKLFGWFGGSSVDPKVSFGRRGFRPLLFWIFAASWTETISGILVLVGLLGPFGPAGVMASMLVVCFTSWQGGLWNKNQATELALAYLAAGSALLLAGLGAYSFDAAVGLRLPPEASWLAFAAAVGGVAVALIGRSPAPPTPAKP